MSKITKISVQEKNKKRCNLFLDNEFYAGVSLETVLKFRLKVGDDIDQAGLADLIFDSDKVEALSKAVAYTTKALKTKKQVKTYLSSKGYSYDVIKYCIAKLEEYCLVDDLNYSVKFIELNSNNQGKHLLEYKLMEKGVSKDVISMALEHVEIDLNKSAKAIAEKRLKDKKITREILSKTYRYLVGKGFSYDEVNFALSGFVIED